MPDTRPWPKKPERKHTVTERAWPSIRRALGRDLLPALRQLAFGVSEDQVALHVWATFDATADEDEREALGACMADVYADFAYPEHGDPCIHEHVVLVERGVPLLWATS